MPVFYNPYPSKQIELSIEPVSTSSEMVYLYPKKTLENGAYAIISGSGTPVDNSNVFGQALDLKDKLVIFKFFKNKNALNDPLLLNANCVDLVYGNPEGGWASWNANRWVSAKCTNAKIINKAQTETATIVAEPISIDASAKFNNICSSFDKSNIFPFYEKTFNINFDNFWDKLVELFRSENDKLITIEKHSGLLISDLNRHGIIGFPRYDKYLIFCSKISDNNTKIHFKLASFDRNMFSESYTGKKELKPKTKSEIDKLAKDFLDKLEVIITSK
jgi:hypothetical protein